jgi:hypothetical protein
MYPVFLNEKTVKPFVFYRFGSLYHGLMLKYKFFKLVKYFDNLNRERAMNLAIGLKSQQFDVVITGSDERYGVWVDLTVDVDCDSIRLFPEESSHASWNDSTFEYSK